MEPTLKCACAHCSGEIEYPPEMAGDNVACPHCGETVALAAESEPVTEAPPPRGLRRGLVVGVVVAVLVAGGSASAYYFGTRGKVMAGQNHTPKSDAPSAHTDSIPDSEPSTPIRPVIRKYQAGLEAKRITVGREVYLSKCSECHRFFDPASYTPDEWSSWIGKMRGKAKLGARDSDELNVFLSTIRRPQ
jgi:DNA-directed RNA polymerase subunit RPC12/RpoP